MKPLRHLLAAIILLPALWGCNDDNTPLTEEATSYDIVCLSDISNTEGMTFTLTRPGGSELITYRTKYLFKSDALKKGDRLLLAYIPNSGAAPYRSGYITPKGYSTITNDQLRVASLENLSGWDSDPVYMLSAWLSQDYLNIRARLPFTADTARSLMVVLDEATTGDTYPTCYLAHRLEKPVNTFNRAYYLSVDMSAMRTKLPTARGFILRVNNSNLKTDSYKFEFLNYK